MNSLMKMPPISKKKSNESTAENQLVVRNPAEVTKLARQSDMLKDMKSKFSSIEQQLRRDPNFDINDKDIELLRSYVVATTQPMQSIKLLKEQAKEREAAEEYEKELEKIIQRAEIVDKTTKEYTNEQKEAISLINDKDKILKEAAKQYENEVQREKEEDKRIADLTKEIEKVTRENEDLEKKNKIVVRGINKMRKIKEFLEEVARSREEFDKKIELVKSRFDTLRSGTKDLKRNLEILDKKIERKRIKSIKKLDDLDKDILLEQNKRPGIRKNLEQYEREINMLSDKEKHGNENLIKKHKKWTQIRLAIDHLIDFIDHFTEVSTGDGSKPKPMGPKFQVTVKEQQEEKKDVTTNKEIEELNKQIVKLEKIKKQAEYWYNIYQKDMASFNPNLLYDEIKQKKSLNTQGQSSTSPKKRVEGGQTGKDITNPSDSTKKA